MAEEYTITMKQQKWGRVQSPFESAGGGGVHCHCESIGIRKEFIVRTVWDNAM